MNKDLNFSERLRKNMKEKGPEAAKKWDESLKKAMIQQTIEENKEVLKKPTDNE